MRLTSNWPQAGPPKEEEVGPAQEEQEKGPEQDAEVPGEENQQQAAEAGLGRSGRTRRATEWYGGAQPMQKENNQLSPRERKRIKRLAAKKGPREEWMTRQEGVWKKYRQPTE